MQVERHHRERLRAGHCAAGGHAGGLGGRSWGSASPCLHLDRFSPGCAAAGFVRWRPLPKLGPCKCNGHPIHHAAALGACLVTHLLYTAATSYVRMQVGIKALAPCPLKSSKRDPGLKAVSWTLRTYESSQPASGLHPN